MRAYLAQARAEIRLTLTQGESLLVTLGIPLILLVGLDVAHIVPTGTRREITFLAPGILSLAIMATGLVSLAIATAFERNYGVLKRLGATPLGRPALLAAKTSSIAVVEIIQTAVILLVGSALGWHPLGHVAEAAAAIVLGTVAFSGIGLFLAGALKAEVVLGLSNALYLVMLMLGGMAFPISRLPGALHAVAVLLPASALSQALVHSLGTGGAVPLSAWAVLVIWAVGAPALAVATFSWE